MREILFRGKRPDNDEWVCGYAILTEGKAFILNNVTLEFRTGYNENRLNFVAQEVIPETVGQYTGLKDTNGTKIFEGDIVKYGDTVHEVVFEQRNGTAYFGLVYSTIETLSFGHYQDLKQIEVVGNIHDNPELLKGGEG